MINEHSQRIRLILPRHFLTLVSAEMVQRSSFEWVMLLKRRRQLASVGEERCVLEAKHTTQEPPECIQGQLVAFQYYS